jgi:hypothetical protein
MSEAVELYKQDGTATGVFYCSECRAVFPNADQAQICHGQRTCECGKQIESRYQTYCDDCWRNKSDTEQREKESKRFDVAAKIQWGDYKGGMIFNGDRYFTDLEELEDHYFDAPLPAYVWACKDVGVSKASPDSIYENMLDGMWEDADEGDLNGREELEAAIAAFNKANESISVWEPDYGTAILIPKSERETAA